MSDIRIPAYQAIAQKLDALNGMKEVSERHNWSESHYNGMRDKTEESLARVLRNMPSGSGIDNGTKLSDASHAMRLVFDVSFHHMNANGYYIGWRDYRVIVTPNLVSGFTLRITGRDPHAIKDYLFEVYHTALTESVDPYEYESELMARKVA